MSCQKSILLKLLLNSDQRELLESQSCLSDIVVGHSCLHIFVFSSNILKNYKICNLRFIYPSIDVGDIPILHYVT